MDLERCLFDGIPTAIRIRTAWIKARGKIRGFLGSLHVSLDESELRLCRSALQRSRAKPASRPAKQPARMFKRTLDEASQPTISQPEWSSYFSVEADQPTPPANHNACASFCAKPVRLRAGQLASIAITFTTFSVDDEGTNGRRDGCTPLRQCRAKKKCLAYVWVRCSVRSIANSRL